MEFLQLPLGFPSSPKGTRDRPDLVRFSLVTLYPIPLYLFYKYNYSHTKHAKNLKNGQLYLLQLCPLYTDSLFIIVLLF